MDFLTETANRGFAAVLIYLDSAKAFDKVSHKALIYKLQCYGYNEKLIRWLIGFLTKRRQRVNFNLLPKETEIRWTATTVCSHQTTKSNLSRKINRHK